MAHVPDRAPFALPDLGGRTGRLVAATLLVTAVLTVAVCVVAGVGYLAWLLPVLEGRERVLGVVVVAVVAAGVLVARHRSEGGRATAALTTTALGPLVVLVGLAVLGRVEALGAAGRVPAAVVAALLLVVAGGATAGFPALAALLARDGRLPRQLGSRADRPARVVAVVLFAAVVAAVVAAGTSARLTAPYLVTVLLGLALGQARAVAHWSRAVRTERARRRLMHGARVLAGLAALAAGALVVVVLGHFPVGWTAVPAVAAAYALMAGTERHYARVAAEVALDPDDAARALPSRVHALVVVAQVTKPTLRAVAYARATRPDVLEAVTVADGRDAEEVMDAWEAAGLPAPLRVLAGPAREITRPVVAYVRSIRRAGPRDLVVVYLPEYVVAHWWERPLHNRSAARIRDRLRAAPGVVVAAVPWQAER